MLPEFPDEESMTDPPFLRLFFGLSHICCVFDWPKDVFLSIWTCSRPLASVIGCFCDDNCMSLPSTVSSYAALECAYHTSMATAIFMMHFLNILILFVCLVLSRRELRSLVPNIAQIFLVRTG